ncbi:unnamed protein product, partial [Polarella glacialis]
CGASVTCNPTVDCWNNNTCEWEDRAQHGMNCSGSCERAIGSCREAAMGKCWQWNEATQSSLEGDCHAEFSLKYEEAFQRCLELGHAAAFAAALALAPDTDHLTEEQRSNLKLHCVGEVLPADWHCLQCNGEWNSWAVWSRIQGPACVAGNITWKNGALKVPAACSSTCQPQQCPDYPVNCWQEIDEAAECQWDDNGVKLCNRSNVAAVVVVAATYPQCASCKVNHCGWECRETSCENMHGFWSPADQCSGCTPTRQQKWESNDPSASCVPGSSCFVSRVFDASAGTIFSTQQAERNAQ